VGMVVTWVLKALSVLYDFVCPSVDYRVLWVTKGVSGIASAYGHGGHPIFCTYVGHPCKVLMIAYIQHPCRVLWTAYDKVLG
jgi:hypothetical protein